MPLVKHPHWRRSSGWGDDDEASFFKHYYGAGATRNSGAAGSATPTAGSATTRRSILPCPVHGEYEPCPDCEAEADMRADYMSSDLAARRNAEEMAQEQEAARQAPPGAARSQIARDLQRANPASDPFFATGKCALCECATYMGYCHFCGQNVEEVDWSDES